MISSDGRFCRTIISLKSIIGISLFLSLGFAYAEEDETKEVHNTIHQFQIALLDNDIKKAQEVSTEYSKGKEILDTLAIFYSSEDKYCQAFKKATGSDPNFSSRSITNENIKNCEVVIVDDTAWTLFGNYSLRKIKGKWKIDLAELDYSRALFEQLEYLKTYSNFYENAIKQIVREKENRPWIVESHFKVLKGEFEGKNKNISEKIREILCQREIDNLQGQWQVDVIPCPSELNPQPKFEQFKAVLSIKNSKIIIDSPHVDLNRSDELHFSSLGMETDKKGNHHAESSWEIKYIRIIHRLQGVMTFYHDAKFESYSVRAHP